MLLSPVRLIFALKKFHAQIDACLALSVRFKFVFDLELVTVKKAHPPKMTPPFTLAHPVICWLFRISAMSSSPAVRLIPHSLQELPKNSTTL